MFQNILSSTPISERLYINITSTTSKNTAKVSYLLFCFSLVLADWATYTVKHGHASTDDKVQLILQIQ